MVLPALQERIADLVVTDLQIGSMGGLAIAMQLTLEAAAGLLDRPMPVLVLLDRRADTFLAKRTGVAGWLLKPLDPLRHPRCRAGPPGRRDVLRHVRTSLSPADVQAGVPVLFGLPSGCNVGLPLGSGIGK